MKDLTKAGSYVKGSIEGKLICEGFHSRRFPMRKIPLKAVPSCGPLHDGQNGLMGRGRRRGEEDQVGNYRHMRTQAGDADQSAFMVLTNQHSKNPPAVSVWCAAPPF